MAVDRFDDRRPGGVHQLQFEGVNDVASGTALVDVEDELDGRGERSGDVNVYQGAAQTLNRRGIGAVRVEQARVAGHALRALSGGGAGEGGRARDPHAGGADEAGDRGRHQDDEHQKAMLGVFA